MRAIFNIAVLLLCGMSSRAGFHKPTSPFTASSSNYDVIYHRISLTVNPASSAAISNGSVTTYFRTTVANVSSIEFDLDGAMSVSSATYHGAAITKSHNTSTDVLTLTIPNIAVIGTLDSVTVNYSGTPILAPSSGVPSGYNWKTHNSTVKMIYTLDEPYTAHNWWPCKESLSDKIDSCVELIVTAPNTYKVAGNGTVTEVASGSDIITTWKTFYPTATYGVNFAVANYSNYQFSIVTGGQTLQVMNYLFAEHFNSTYKAYCDQLKTIIPMYATVLGVDYPFLNEKYGLAECTSGWGALEVPSMTFVASDAYDKYTLAHEAAHQWFGDMITTNDWHQVWLNEGFAKYFESVVFPENLYPSELAAKRSSLKSSVSNSLTTYVSDISTPNNVFIGSTSEPYEKGAMVLSMLRAWVGDANFFAALKNYLTAPGIQHGFTAVDSLKKYMQQKTPLDLTNFFDDWVLKKGRVTYSVKYQFVTKGIYIQLTQSPTFGGAGYFDTPVPIRIQGTGLDTTVVIIDKRGVLYNSVTGASYATNVIYYPLSKTPTAVPVFDPNDVILALASAPTAATLNNLITLPFKNIRLTAAGEGRNVKLNWSVETDESLQSIVIERSSNNSDFTPVQTIVPVQIANQIYGGSFVDEMTGRQQYYRLKIVKLDGSFVYSQMESVRYNVSQLQVVPNPVRNELSVVMPADFNDGEMKLMIQNLSGQLVKEMNWNSADTRINLPVKNLVPGVYSLVLINRKKERIQSNFIKQ
jgi:hypothetical protein